MTSKWTFLGIFIYKEELIITSCIANQFYLDKIKRIGVKFPKYWKKQAPKLKDIGDYSSYVKQYQICVVNLAQDFHFCQKFFSFCSSHLFDSNFLKRIQIITTNICNNETTPKIVWSTKPHTHKLAHKT